MAWHPLTRLLVALGPLVIAGSYLLTPEDPSAVPAVVRAGNAQAALPPEGGAAPPAPALVAAPDLSTLTETVERPLFSTSRRAPQPLPEPEPVVEAPVATPAAPPPSMTLQGVMLAGDRSAALLRRDDTGETVTLHEGDNLTGWQVERIAAGSVTLSGPDGAAELPLFPPAP